ncbi:hypothetical protein SPRG_04494 [Saprolegnia parasitica CBS 223.65]|uniref:N-acetyltransferase domain-containing protein n=1 Tax=Saprolegnia parasitica (strain CBS 223.65) TaxID=695850 RepID=A0A067CIN8_SAPPC|nr:hypothetical protein SPRG_04494 [Saprolegnia parasitica CBS 223.65]KDO30594.1 hypothetical protein SPRG_04494 [Saprolegnia parasitica CBS 223.65]|eukprot:XP_012198808.1 hypothetical protein SPRG_04494 [Saprolegnia parasitica CBS 223.65]
MGRAAIRLASPQEHADIELLLHALGSAQCKLSTEPTHIGQKHVFVAETSGPIGVLVLLRDQDVAVIDALAVDPIHRSQGTGSDLVRAAERFLVSEAKETSRYLALSCVPSDAAERFAQRLGFAEYSGEFDAVTGARLVVYRKPVGDHHAPDASMGDDVMGAFLAQVDGSEDPSLAASAKTPLFASILSTMRLDTLEALATDLGSTACIEMLTDDGDDDRETPESLDSLVRLLMTQLRDPSHAELVTSFRPSPESSEEKE